MHNHTQFMRTAKQRSNEPTVGRPHFPGYGISKSRKDLLPWKWAEDILSRTKNYLFATTRSDGRPHVMPIWGVWTDGHFYFSTGKKSVKARNLAANPKCVLCAGTAEEAVMLEGIVEKVGDKKTVGRVATVYFEKYDFDFSKMNEPIFMVRPRVAFGQIEKTFVKTATRWKFD
jgi:general stress protein 26